MNLKEILNENIIDLSVEGNSKDEVLHNMAKLLLKNEYIDNEDEFVKGIYEREAEGPTGMGQGISIPHGKSLAVKKIGICIGKTKNPIKWESAMYESGFQETRLVFLFCVSVDNSFAENHMLLLSELAGKLGNETRVNKLVDAKSKQEIIDLILCDDSTLDSSDTTSEEEIVDLDIDF